jgi:Domain of unknown function (DUF4188)
MPSFTPGRMTAAIDGDFVVFLIGVRVNRPWKVHKWLPVLRAMPRMLAELQAHPECGCLAVIGSGFLSIQYWRSFDDLEAYARSQAHAHWPAWTAFNRTVRSTSGDVGIWHESYLVRAGEYETVYGSMPRMGLARAGRHLPVAAHQDGARDRLRSHPTV